MYDNDDIFSTSYIFLLNRIILAVPTLIGSNRFQAVPQN